MVQLQDAFGSIFAAAVPLVDKRSLARYAVNFFLGGGLGPQKVEAASPASAGCVIHDKEAIMMQAARGRGIQTRLAISGAKQVLRGLGSQGQCLASRVGRASKGRNACAHLDVALAFDIERLFH